MYLQFEETLRQQRIRGWGFRELLPHATYTRYTYLDGGLQSAELHVDNHWDWENGNYVAASLNGAWDGLRVPFQVYPGVIVPPGEHGGYRLRLQMNTDRRKGAARTSGSRRFSPAIKQPDVSGHPAEQRTFHARHHVDVPRYFAASGGVPHEPRQHARDV
jgi:hypothetical protein